MQFRLHLIVSRQFIDIFFNIHRKDCFPALDEGFQETFHTQTKNCFNRNISTYYANVCISRMFDSTLGQVMIIHHVIILTRRIYVVVQAPFFFHC